MRRSTPAIASCCHLFIALVIAACGSARTPLASRSAPADAGVVAPIEAIEPDAAVPDEREAAAPEPVEGRASARPSPEWTVATRLANPPVDLPKGVTGVVAHVPTGFDIREPIHLVLFLHGSSQCVAQIALSGDVVCRPGARPIAGSGLVQRHDDAATNTVFVAPQFILWGGGTPGKMADRGYFRSFVEELLRDTLAPALGGPRTLDDLADITIVAHSAGRMPLKAILDRGELDDKVKNVVLLDALYDGRVGTYARWLERGMAAGEERKLVAIYGDWGRNPATGRAIASRIEGHAPGSTVIDPPGAIEDAIRSHEVTVAIWNVDHVRMLVLTMSKVLEALGLPGRETYPPRTPSGEPPAPVGIAVGARVTGALEEGDSSLENGALFDDYAIDLEAGQSLDIDLRGGHSKTERCCTLDVFLEVLQDGRSLAHDDDGSGGFDARLSWTAPAAGRYVVRVSTSGSGRKRGAYTLSIR